MTGEDLYEDYRRITLEVEGCEIEESWENLSFLQQVVWNTLAEMVI